MFEITPDYIRKSVAFSDVIYRRGMKLYEYGSFSCMESDLKKGSFVYEVDGNYGDYVARVQLLPDGLDSSCNCPYPEKGCKHTVAVLLDVCDRINAWVSATPDKIEAEEPSEPSYLTPEEIRELALEDRRRRAGQEAFKIVWGDMFKGEHVVETAMGRQYVVTLHDPERGLGHCTCPDFLTNRLGTCKHLIYLCHETKKRKDYKTRSKKERFPFIDIFWDSINELPRLFCERPDSEIKNIRGLISAYFDENGLFRRNDHTDFAQFLSTLNHNKRVRVQEEVFSRIDDYLQTQELLKVAEEGFPEMDVLKSRLYPYQELGVKFALHKKAALIGDDMGLGKTLQAIALAILKRKVFDFRKVLVVTLASLKEQWKREIERFTDEDAVIIQGSFVRRKAIYEQDKSLFRITNYEAVLRDISALDRFKPDLVILDEAQRIKNFNTKTAEVVKGIPRKHSLVLTGTPLENRLEDVYSIVQFLDPHILSPLWKFAADHFMLSRNKKGKILGYRNLDRLQQKLKPLVIRRKKEEVLTELPEVVENSFYIDLTERQIKIHNGYLQSLLPLLNKKYLTPMDIRRIQELLLRMRMVCNSTYLIDRKTHISPKLNELKSIMEDLIGHNGRKVVIFTEWTTMTFLIGKQLSAAGIPFVELTGKIPVKKRQALIDEFTCNPECKVFLSTDAGGTGLNLQAADCVINFELPWNPSRLNQRVGRVHRIGQRSRCVNVINLISKSSIEEKILAGLQLKMDLFKGVFEDGPDQVEFTREKRTELLNRLRQMLGEDPQPIVSDDRPVEEIPEDTPHYLNPRVLNEDRAIAVEAEEHTEEPPSEQAAGSASEEAYVAQGGGFAGQPPERIEAVLNSGMQFLGGLLEMATGKKLEAAADEKPMIRIDRETGEVTLKFRLPV
ncbi:MAG: DEAD/DEAH box helicase [Desulfobacterales bacterium]|nr:DEAD/DEAH box helicase [Desulfobacterales bacterium]